MIKKLIFAFFAIFSAFQINAAIDPNGINDNPSIATSFSAPGNSPLDSINSSDIDYFKFTASSSGIYNISLLQSNLTISSNYSLTIYNGTNTSTNQLYSISGNISNTPEIDLIAKAGCTYYIKIDQTGSPNIGFYNLVTTFSNADPNEPNNNFIQATPISLNGTLTTARLFGKFGYGCSSSSLGSYNNMDQDQDFFKITPTQHGVLNLNIDNVNSNQNLVVEIFNSTFNQINSKTGSLGGNIQLSTLLETGDYYIRVSDYDGGIWDPITMADDPFNLTLSFDTSDSCECNNTFQTACTKSINSNFTAKLWGLNSLISNSSTMDLDQDQDFYKVTSTQHGVLNININNVNANQNLNIQIFNSAYTLINSKTGALGGNVELSTLLEIGDYYIRISDYDGGIWDPVTMADDPFNINFTFDSSDSCECNNTFQTACTKLVNSTFSAKLWGENILISDASTMDRDEDQDFYKITPTQHGVLNVNIDNVNANQDLIVEVYNSSYVKINQSPGVSSGSNINFSTLLEPGNYYLRIIDGTGGWNIYQLADDPFTITLSFDISDSCECNNTFQTACTKPLNSNFTAKLWGENYLISNSSTMDLDEDQDIYKINTTECGYLNVQLSNINSTQNLEIEIFDGTNNLINSTVGALGSNVSLNTLLNPGLYYIRITDGTGTWDSYTLADDPFNVIFSFNPLSSISSNTLPSCIGQSINFTSPNNSAITSYQWNFGPNATPTSSNVQNPTGVVFNTAGSHIITLTANGCSIDSQTITILPLPTVAASNVNGCSGTSINLSGTPAGGSFSLPNPYTGPSTTYTYQYTDSNGCSNTSSNATITTNSLPTISITASPGLILCQGDSLTLSGNGAGTTNYSWSPSSVSNGIAFTPSASSTYTVTGIDANNCSNTTSISITLNNLPPIPTITAAGTLLTSSAAANYQWYLNNATIAGATNNTWQAVQNGSYKICATNICGESCSDPFEVKTVGIDDIFTNNLITIYPNPVEAILTIKNNSNFSITQICVTDLTGKIVYVSNETERPINIAHLSKGIYLMQFEIEHKKYVTRFTKQ